LPDQNLGHDGGLKRAIIAAAGLFVLSRGLMTLIAWLSTSVIAKERFFANSGTFFGNLFGFDANWYMHIVREGYSWQARGESSLAFFPLYPLLVRMLSATGLPDAVVAVALSNLFFLGALIMLYRLTEHETGDEKTALYAAALLAFYPGSMYCSIAYTEAMFLFLSITAFYCARTGRWLAAAALCGALSATRSSGVLMALPVLYEYALPNGLRGGLRSPLFSRTVAVFALLPSGLAAYMAFLWYRFGDPLLFMKAQGGWGRRLSWVWETFATVGQHEMFYRFLFIGSACFLLLACIMMCVLRMRGSYILYSVVSWLFFVSFFYLEGIMRFVGVVFPMYIALAIVSRRRPMLYTALLAAFAMLMAVSAVMFANGYWLT